MNRSVDVRINSKITEYFIKQLTIENAVAERLVTRIHKTPIEDLTAPRAVSKRNYGTSGKSISINH